MQPTTACVLGDGGARGAAEVGMLRPVAERAVRPDLMVGSGIGALNGGAVRSRPDGRRRAAPGTRLDPPAPPQVFAGSIFGRLSTRARRGTYPHPNAALARQDRSCPPRRLHLRICPSASNAWRRRSSERPPAGLCGAR